MGKQVTLGIDVGGTNVKIAFVDEDGNVVIDDSRPTEPEQGPETFSKALGKHVRDMADRAGIVWDDVAGVGVGLPGFIDIDRGILEEAVNLKWKNVPVVDLLQAEFGKSVFLDNDANLAALGEVWLGAGQDAKAALCVTLGTGVGGGIIIEGRVYRGVAMMGGEIGHIPVQANGPLCNCGHHGCLETLASATALVRMGEQAGLHAPDGRDELTAEHIFMYAANDNERAEQVIHDMIFWLAQGLACAGNLLNPDIIVISGGVVNAGEALMNPLREAFKNAALERVSRFCRIEAARLGSSAGQLGAARLAWQHLGIHQ